ncbi:hypothetical protein C8D88_116123 [Lentzea atacamensis]|uniref:Uncharacterized protein n=1 Tax=Lentzea atacamensis TaxID=531938 RepID=A0A316HKF8_9PSEU|nr:hypothetical protein [Lentzea atacamensis]PWK81711.1 hypothetical protein C8D88_116123 [Lentzea atacamensis]
MTVKQIAITGLLVLIVGLLLGFVPGSAEGVPCGSPWSRDTAMIDAANRGADLGSALAGRGSSSVDYRAICGDALDGRGVFGGVLAGLGVLTLLGAALVNARQTTGVDNG